MMPRLTKSIRENMAAELLKLRFAERGQALAARSIDLFKLVYESRYDQETRRLIARLKKKFRDGFGHHRRICCNAGGLSIDVGSTRIGAHGVIVVPDVTPVPLLSNDNIRSHFTFGDCEIGTALQQFAADTAAFTTEINDAHRELIGALSSVTTDNQLAELWPEAMPLLEKYVPVASGRNLPAVQFSKLTQSYGLPPVVEANDAA